MISLQDIREARERIRAAIQPTPMVRATGIGQLVGCDLWPKPVNRQRAGSFKLRGAVNRIAALTLEERRRGVIAASAGNHAQGVALAAREVGVPATIVMPRDASFAKVEATRGYGAEVVLFGHSFDEAMHHAQALARDRSLVLVHAFDDPMIVAGQGTIGLEITEAMPDVEAVLVPVGGGGLLAGIALAVKETAPMARVYGVQAAAAPAWVRSFESRALTAVPASSTVADGIAVGEPGRTPAELIWRYVDGMVTVSDEKIAQAMVLVLERGKLLVEGAGAVGLAALLEGKVDCAGKKTVAVLSGGNIDPTLLSRVIEQGLAEAGRFMVLRVAILDRPGRLAAVLERVAAAEANVLEVYHHRKGFHLPVGQVEVEVLLETRDAAHADAVRAAFTEAGYAELEPESLTGLGPTVRRFVAGEARNK